MTAEATGVKKIAVTFNQAVDTTTTKIVVKKGSATPTIAATTPAEDAKSYEIAMGTKLTAGTYTVEATVGEKVLTADITVQDEKLTAFELVSKNLVADPEITTKASISYKAVNQYGEMMAPGTVQATCSFGTVTEHKQPTADKAGSITVENINTALAIVGTTGTLVLVDTTNGVNLNETITYQSKAIPAAATIEGIYSEKTEKLIEGNLKSKSKVGDYYILMNIQNQYGDDMNADAIAKSGSDLSFNPASVLTNLGIADSAIKKSENNTVKDISYNGKTCILVKLTAGADTNGTIDKAGTLNLTIVSSNKGVLASPSFTVEDAVTISSLSISPADTVYANVENKLVVDATDSNGNAVTKYDDLKNAITASSTKGTITLKKNADGTGTFYYKPVSLTPTKQNKYKDSTIDTLIFNVNDNTSSNYMVKTVNLTVYADQLTWKVSGVTANTVTAVAVDETAGLTFDLSTLNYEDQYGNTIGYDKVTDKTKIQYKLVDKNGVFSSTTPTVTDVKKLNFTPAAKGTATLYLSYASDDADKKELSDENYDIKVDLSVVDVNSMVASDLSVKVNDGKTICGIEKVTLTPSITSSAQATTGTAVATVVVTGKVAGKSVVIPADKITITSGTVGGYGKVDNTNPEKTETKTVTVVVDSEEGPQILTAEVTVSNAGQKATEIKKDNSAKTNAASSQVSASELISTIKIVDQYGIAMNGAGSVVYTVTLTGNKASELTVAKNATQNAVIKAADGVTPSGDYTASVKYEFGGLTFTQDITMTF